MSKVKKFSTMYYSYADDIFRYLMAHVHDEQLAEDLTADTFTKAWQALDTFDFRQPRPWLYTIAQRTMISHWRKKSSLPLDESIEVPSDDESLETQTETILQNDALHAAIKQLPSDMQSVVTLRFLLGHSARDTGKRLGLSEANVRVIQYRALKKLKGLLS